MFYLIITKIIPFLVENYTLSFLSNDEYHADTLFLPHTWRACQNWQRCIQMWRSSISKSTWEMTAWISRSVPALAIPGIWFFTSVLTLTLYQPLHQFRLKDGIRRVPHYGLLLARVAGLPASVIDTATSITSQITQQVTWYLLLAITRLCHHLLGLYMLRRM